MTQFIRVEVSEGRAYTYQWNGTPSLAKGDKVVLPSNIVRDREFTGRVIRLLDEPDTDYPLKDVVRRVGPALGPEDEDLL